MSFVGDLRSVLRGRDFRKLFAVRLTSQFADGVFQVALASYVFFSPERQTSAGAAAAAFAVLLLPYSVVGPFAGVLLDRWSRRQVLFWANAIRVVLMIGVASLVASDVAGVAFYVLVLGCLSVNRFLLAGLSAALPHTVPRDELVMANAVSPTSGTVAFLLGGATGFSLRELLPVGGSDDVRVLACAAVLYGGAALLALRLGRRVLGPDYDPAQPAVREAVGSVVRGFLDGGRHVLDRRPVADALAMITVHRMGYALATISTILLYRNTFNDPADTDAGLTGLATALGLSGAGVFAAALLTPVVVPRIGKHRWMVGLLVAAGVVQLGLGGTYTEPALLVAAFLLGLASQGIKICVDTIVQQEVDDAFRGRVFSLYDLLFNAAFVASAAIAALALPPSGKSYALLAAVAVVYLGAAYAYQRRARLSASGSSVRASTLGPDDPGHS